MEKFFTYLDSKDLAKVSRVCRFFFALAKSNVVWKEAFRRKWTMPSPWIGPLPSHWKHEYYVTQKLLSEIGKKKFSHKEEKALLFWKKGVINSAPSLSHPFKEFLSQMSGKEIETLSVKEPYHSVGTIIDAINHQNYPQALERYYNQRQQLIKKNPIIGWWMCRLCEILMRNQQKDFSIDKKNHIHFPSEVTDHRWISFESLIEGSISIWMKQNKEEQALLSLSLYLKSLSTYKSINEEIGTFFHGLLRILSETSYLDETYLAIQDSIFLLPSSSIKWKIFQDYFKALNSQNKSALELKFIQKLIPYLTQNLPTRFEETLEFQVACLPILYLKTQGKEGLKPSEIIECALIVREYEIELAYRFTIDFLNTQISEKNLSFSSLELLYYVQFDLLGKLDRKVEAIKIWSKIGGLYFKNQITNRLEDPVTKSSFFDLGYAMLKDSPNACETLIHMDPPYSPHADMGIAYAHSLVNNFSPIPSLLNQALSRLSEEAYPEALSLYIKMRRYTEAIRIWQKLGHSYFKRDKGAEMPTLPLSFFDTGYSILKESEQARKVLIASPPPYSPYADIGVAYAYFLDKNFSKAYSILEQAGTKVFPEALRWVREVSKQDLQSALLYSSFLNTASDLEDYFDELFDYYPKENFLLYLYLAKRLVKVNDLKKGIAVLQLALEIQPQHDEALNLERTWKETLQHFSEIQGDQ